MKDLIKNLQLGLLIIILISTVVAVFLEIYNMYQVKTVTLASKGLDGNVLKLKILLQLKLSKL